jgi:ABC-2 type transport system ATP-binding protein
LLCGLLYNIPKNILQERVNQLLVLFVAEDLKDRQVRTLSLGQRMRIEIISSILHRPKVLFLDEPTLGLDSQAQKILRSTLKKLNQQEKMFIFLTSHYMKDISDLCRVVGVLDKGKKVFEGSLPELKKQEHTNKYIQSIVSEL